ncbi:MAG TPA: hypothetical protein PKJ45_10345 [Rubrivivax sp.]|nr:hypothetical protein [Rubrivivax sp.]
MKRYRPRAGSAPSLAIAELQRFPAGTEFDTATLAKRVDISPDNLATVLAAAVAGGALSRRHSVPGVVRSPLLWSLGPNAVDLNTLVPAAPATTSAEQAKRRFNFRLNADVTSHSMRLADAHHPAAAKPAPAEPVITEATRITRGPSWTHDPRFTCGPGEQPYGAGFSAAKPGFDVTTGRPWA